MNKMQEKINANFIHGFEEERNKAFEEKNIMYHYTSAEAFLSIIENKTLRFTDFRYLNDKSEGIYFVKTLLDFLVDNKGKYPIFEEVVNELLKENDFDKIRRLEVTSVKYAEVLGMPYKPSRKFVFCMCEEGDMLNMWNYYVNNSSYQGYSIGFKAEQLINGVNALDNPMADGISIYYGNVIYNKNEQYKVIANYAEKLQNAIKRSSSEGKGAERMAYLIAQLKVRSYIDSKGIFYKHHKFKQEKEFRIVIEVSKDTILKNKEQRVQYEYKPGKYIYQDFCVKRGLIVPFIAVPFSENAISRITCAPMVEFNIAKQSVRELLNRSDYNGVPVYSSSIPIRF